MNKFQQDILKKIKTGEVDMKPRWHFILKSLLLVFSVITAVLVVVYLLSFVIFTLRQSGVGFTLLYGFRGISMFVMSSPWLLIASAGAAVVVLQVLVHKYSFSYRQPLLYTIIGVVFLMLIGSYVIEQTSLHQRMQGFAKQHEVPVFGSMYRNAAENRPKNIVRGTIVELNQTGFVIESDRKETLKIVVSQKTKQRPGEVYSVGETLLIFGDRKRDVVDAIGVRPAVSDIRFEDESRREHGQGGEVRGIRTGAHGR